MVDGARPHGAALSASRRLHAEPDRRPRGGAGRLLGAVAPFRPTASSRCGSATWKACRRPSHPTPRARPKPTRGNSSARSRPSWSRRIASSDLNPSENHHDRQNGHAAAPAGHGSGRLQAALARAAWAACGKDAGTAALRAEPGHRSLAACHRPRARRLGRGRLLPALVRRHRSDARQHEDARVRADRAGHRTLRRRDQAGGLPAERGRAAQGGSRSADQAHVHPAPAARHRRRRASATSGSASMPRLCLAFPVWPATPKTLSSTAGRTSSIPRRTRRSRSTASSRCGSRTRPRWSSPSARRQADISQRHALDFIAEITTFLVEPYRVV